MSIYAVLVLASIVILLTVHGQVPFVIAAAFYGLCYSFATVGLTMICRELFGQEGFGIVYPVGALGCSFSNAVFSSAVGFGYDLTGGYTISLVGFACFIVAAVALATWAYKKNERA